jgi:hypothetical protein
VPLSSVTVIATVSVAGAAAVGVGGVTTAAGAAGAGVGTGAAVGWVAGGFVTVDEAADFAANETLAIGLSFVWLFNVILGRMELFFWTTRSKRN